MPTTYANANLWSSILRGAQQQLHALFTSVDKCARAPGRIKARDAFWPLASVRRAKTEQQHGGVAERPHGQQTIVSASGQWNVAALRTRMERNENREGAGERNGDHDVEVENVEKEVGGK